MILKTDAQGRSRPAARRGHDRAGRPRATTRPARSTAGPSVALSVYQRPGSNALETAELVRDKMEELKDRFPDGLDYAIVYDTTPFIDESVNEVFNTLRDAVILVAFVVLLFLQNWRSAIIPLVAVPVAIVGTFAVMAALGFSLEQPDALRAGAGDRHRGRRRDRGGRGGRAPHRARPGAARGDDHGDEPGLGAGDRGRPGAHGRVRPVRVHHGDHRPVLPPVRPDDRHLDGDLGVQLADPEPGPGGALAAAAAEGGRIQALPWPAFVGVGGWARLRASWARTLLDLAAAAASTAAAGALARPYVGAGLATGRRGPGRLAGQRSCSTGCSAGSSTCSTRASTRRRASTPGWSAGCCGSACWCCCSTAGCWG